MADQCVGLTCLEVEQKQVCELKGAFCQLLCADGHEEAAPVLVRRDVNIAGTFRQRRCDARLDVVERVVATVAPAGLTVVGLEDLVYVLVLLLGHLLVDGHHEVLQVIRQPGVSLAAVLADRRLFARLYVNRLVEPSALLLAIATQVTVALGKPTLETVETEFLARLQVDEDVLACRFASLVSDVLVDADVLARAGKLHAVDAFAVHHVGIRPVAFPLGIDFDGLFALHGDPEGVGLVAFAENLDADIVPARNEFKVSALLVAVDEELVFALAVHVDFPLGKACVLQGEGSQV